MTTKRIALTVNGTARALDALPLRRLLDVLREDRGLTGTKEGCGEGECGACTVLIDGAAVNSCLIPVCQVAGREITTIEAAGLERIQEAFVAEGGAQCGICTPGMIVMTKAFLDAQVTAPAYKRRDKVRLQVQSLLLKAGGTHVADVPPYQLNEQDPFGRRVNGYVETQPKASQQAWYGLLEHCSSASGARPSKKYLREAGAAIDGVKPEAFLATMKDWMDFMATMDLTEESQWRSVYLQGMNVEVAKGLVWSLTGRTDFEALQGLDRLAMRCFRKIPHHGATCLALGILLGPNALTLLALLPMAAVGALLLIAGVDLARTRRLREATPGGLAVILGTAVACVAMNVAAGLLVGLAGEGLRRLVVRQRPQHE